MSSKPESSADAQAAQASLAKQMAATGATDTAEGTKLFDMALPGLQQAESYYGKMASGDPNAMARANAPAIQAITKSTDSAKKNIMQNNPRGGELGLALEEADLSKGAQIGQLETGSYTSSFGSLAGLGGQNVGQATSLSATGLSGEGSAANQYQSIQNTNAANKAASWGIGTDLLGTMGDMAAGGMSGGGGSSPCWIAAELFDGWTDRRTVMVRYWLVNVYEKTFIGSMVVGLYRKYGRWAARQVRAYRPVQAAVRPLFSWFLLKAQEV